MSRSIRWVSLVVFVAVFLISASAFAQAGGTRNGFQFIKKGSFDLSFDNALMFKSSTIPNETADVTSSTFDYAFGVTPKYFLIRNYYIGLSLNMSFATTSTSVGDVSESSQDLGFLGFVDTGYYIRLNNSFFLAPRVGAGYYMGTRERPSDGDGTGSLKQESSLSAIAGRVGMDAIFYVGSQWNLRAGVSLMYRSGAETPKDDDAAEGIDFSLMDAFYSVGMGYSF